MTFELGECFTQIIDLKETKLIAKRESATAAGVCWDLHVTGKFDE